MIAGVGLSLAAGLTGAVKQLDADYPGHSDFVAAGDLIGGSTSDSFIEQDKPTIDALNEAALDVSAAGSLEVPFTVSLPGDPPDTTGRARVAPWASARSKRVRVDKTRPRIKVRVPSPDLHRVWGKVQVEAGGRTYATNLHHVKASSRLRAFGQVGRKKVCVKYLGTTRTRKAHTATFVQVHRR